MPGLDLCPIALWYFVKLNINTHRRGDPAPPSTYFLKLDLWLVTVGLPTSGSRVLIPLLKFSLWFPFLFCCLVVGFLPPSFHADSSVWLYRMYFHPFPLSFPWDLHIRNVYIPRPYHPFSKCVRVSGQTKLPQRPCLSDLIYWLLHVTSFPCAHIIPSRWFSGLRMGTFIFISTSPPKVQHSVLYLVIPYVFIEWITTPFSYNSSLQIWVENFQFQTHTLYTLCSTAFANLSPHKIVINQCFLSQYFFGKQDMRNGWLVPAWVWNTAELPSCSFSRPSSSLSRNMSHITSLLRLILFSSF